MKVAGLSENQIDLAATVSARICHDLISPIGAISNGLELLALAGGVKTPEMALISASVKCANAKIRFLRIVYGSAEANTPVRRSEIGGILHDAFTDPRTEIRWEIRSALALCDVQLLFLLILCTEKLAPYGGLITVVTRRDGFDVNLTGEILKSEGYLDFYSNRLLAQSGPSLVQFNLAEAQMARMGYRLELTQSDGEIGFRIQT